MYIQHARGTFKVEVGGRWHCGPDHSSPKEFDYEVSVGWGSRKIDYRGFLADNTMFQEYFDGVGRTEQSCERLIRDAAEEIYRICGKRPRCVVVKIWAIKDHAMVEYRYIPWPVKLLPEWVAGIGLVAEVGRLFFH